MTGSDIKTYFQRHYHVDNYDDNVLIDFLEIINRVAYRLLYQNDPDYTLYSGLVTLDSEDTTYSIVTDFSVSDYGYIDSNLAGLYLYDSDSKEYTKLLYTNPLSNEKGYYIKSGNIEITGELEKDEDSVKLAYVALRTTITALGNTLNIPDEYKHWAATMVKELYDVYDVRDEYDLSLDEMIEKSFRGEMIDSLGSKNRTAVDVNTFDVFKC